MKLRLIDADKIDFEKVFIGASDFAKDTRKAAQSVIDSQPTAYDIEKVGKQLEEKIMGDETIRFVDQAVGKALEIGSSTTKRDAIGHTKVYANIIG